MEGFRIDLKAFLGLAMPNQCSQTRALVKPKNQPGGVALAPSWLKWNKIYIVDV